MSYLCIASDGWCLPPPVRSRRLELSSRLPDKEPNGVRHALAPNAMKTLCAVSVRELTVFAAIGFFSSAPGDRCAVCDALAAHYENVQGGVFTRRLVASEGPDRVGG